MLPAKKINDRRHSCSHTCMQASNITATHTHATNIRYIHYSTKQTLEACHQRPCTRSREEVSEKDQPEQQEPPSCSEKESREQPVSPTHTRARMTQAHKEKTSIYEKVARVWWGQLRCFTRSTAQLCLCLRMHACVRARTHSPTHRIEKKSRGGAELEACSTHTHARTQTQQCTDQAGERVEGGTRRSLGRNRGGQRHEKVTRSLFDAGLLINNTVVVHEQLHKGVRACARACVRTHTHTHTARQSQDKPNRGEGYRKAVDLFLVLGDVEEAELVGGRVGGDHVEEVAELLLLQELLGEVLELALGEGHGSVDAHGGGVAGDLDVVSEVAALVVDLDALSEVAREGAGVDDVLILGVDLGAVDDESRPGDLGGGLGHFRKKEEKRGGRGLKVVIERNFPAFICDCEKERQITD